MTIHIRDNGKKTLSTAVARAITHSGIEVLNGKTQLYSLVSDFLGNAPQSKQSLNLLRNAIECGIPPRLYGAASKDTAEQTLVIATCSKLLMDSYGISEEVAGQFMQNFATALGWAVVVLAPAASKEPSSRQENVSVTPKATNVPAASTATPTVMPQPPGETPQMLYDKGRRYYEGNGVKQSYTEALSWFHKSAVQGFPPAQMEMGNCYYFGLGGQKKDVAKAVEWYTAAGKKGYAAAQFELAYMYYTGNDVVQNYREAAAWFQKAAELGDARAQKMLAECYWHGRGVSQDDRKAAEWYRASAAQDNDEGIAGLGTCYYYGRGVPKDLAEAKRLFQKAADLGNPAALVAVMRM